MKVYLEDDVIFYDYPTGTKTPYWVYVEAFEIAADQNVNNIYDMFLKKWFDKSVVEQTIHCLMEARPNKDWTLLRQTMLSNIF